MLWKKILCPVDFSAGSREALKLAARLAIEEDAVLVIAHVWMPPTYFLGETVGLPPSVVADVVNTAERELAEWQTEAETLGARRVESLFLTGAPWHEIVGVAKNDQTIDLLVVGTHGRTGLRHALLGSVAEKIVRHAPCPTLVVPPAQ